MKIGPKSFVRYAIVGAATNLCLLIVFSLLLEIWSPVLSSSVVYALGIMITYRFNRRWSFGSKGKHTTEAPRYVAAYLVGFLAQIGSISVLGLVIPSVFAQAISMLLAAIFIFAVLKLYVFRSVP